jgi:Ala-tRNA(Pro) deacylase
MPVTRLRDYLDAAGVRYIVISHSKAFTAPEIAASAHIPGRELAKTVIVELDGRIAMAVVPANTHVDVVELQHVTGASEARLATEREFKDRFPGCEVGAMPPFGNLWDMDVYADERLAQDEEIAFNAGSHTELVRMRWDDFERLVRPKITEFAV